MRRSILCVLALIWPLFAVATPETPPAAHPLPIPSARARTAIEAEIARIEGRLLDAEELYEKAIRSAHANSFVHNEGVANEVAARFYSARGFEKIANAYLRDARYCYQRWGADGKVRQFDALHPHLSKPDVAFGPSSMIGTRQLASRDGYRSRMAST